MALPKDPDPSSHLTTLPVDFLDVRDGARARSSNDNVDLNFLTGRDIAPENLRSAYRGISQVSASCARRGNGKDRGREGGRGRGASGAREEGEGY